MSKNQGIRPWTVSDRKAAKTGQEKYYHDRRQQQLNLWKCCGFVPSNEVAKKLLIFEHGERCQICGWHKVHSVTGNVPVELEHSDGNRGNNAYENVKLLCPNCHSLTPTYRALNGNKEAMMSGLRKAQSAARARAVLRDTNALLAQSG